MRPAFSLGDDDEVLDFVEGGPMDQKEPALAEGCVDADEG